MNAAPSTQRFAGRVAVVTGAGAGLGRAVALRLAAEGAGCSWPTSTVNGVGAFGNEAYSAAKAGLASLVRSIAVNYGPDGVRANLVVPGTLRTAAWDERLARDRTRWSGWPAGTRWAAWERCRTWSGPPCSSSPTRRPGSRARPSSWTAVSWRATGR